MSSAPTDRRPAIWPWLVMPLVTLSLYFALDKLHHEHGRASSDFGTDWRTGVDTDATDSRNR